MSNDNRFGDAPISRRRFFQLSATTGAALAMPGNATATAGDGSFTTEYQYVLNHTPLDYAVPTLVRFSGESGLRAFEALDAGEEVHTTTTPTTAAYAQLTTAEAQEVADLPEADEFQFSPGSNPFWRIGQYPLGVFPEPRRSVDYIGFEQLKDGLAELEERYPDRVNVRVAGKSPGHTNNVTDRTDPKQMIVVELTNDVQDREAFAAKEKVFHSCSLHGPERAGAEAGARVVENVARGSEPDVIEEEEKIEPLLDDVAVLVGFTNPDGWVARNPQYDSSWQFDLGDAPAAPLYERGNAEVYDTNRQYPVVGMITPNHYPAQPNDPKSEEEETPSFVTEKVPDAKAFVDFFSQYDNLNYGSDLHGGPIFNEFVLGLISQDQFDTRQMHELYEMCLNIDDVLEEALETWVTAGDIKQTVLGDFRTGLLFGVLPEQAFDYSTIYDTIDYTVTGAFLDWMAHPEPIGLDLTTLDFEMSFSWAINGNIWNPELVEMEVKGYRTAIRTITAFAVRNSDTPTTDDQFEAVTETDREAVAYVTTSRDALTSTEEELVFEDGDGGGGGDGVSRTTDSVSLPEGVTELTFDVEEDLHSAGVHVHGHQIIADLELVDPSGEVVGTFDAVTEERAGGKCCGLPEITMNDPEPGTWTLRVDNKKNVEQDASAMYWSLAASGPNPDPSTAWPDGEGFEQRAYEATPFEFFEDYGDSLKNNTEEEEVIEADVMILMDTSGSMSFEAGKFENAKNGAKTLVDNLGQGVNVGLAEFSSSAGVVAPLGTDSDTIKDEIDNLRSGGGTNMSQGINLTQSELGANGDPNSPNFMIVLANGIPNQQSDTFDEADAARSAGTTIVSIAYGSDADEGVMESISSPPKVEDGTIDEQDENAYIGDQDNIGGIFADIGRVIERGSTVDPVTPAEVADGALQGFDHAVVIHDYGANADADYIGNTTGYAPADHPVGGYDEPGYTEALDDFVDAGGNLVLTDSGVNLITELDNKLVNGDAITREDITPSEFIVPRFEGSDPKNLDHPLFGTEGDVRPIQNQLWKVQPLGYTAGRSDSNGQAPMYLPDETALAAAGAPATTTVAGRTTNQGSGASGIAAASLTPDDTTQRGVHLISSLLPTPTQVNIHPFGLQNYTVTFLGYVMLTSALGFEQVRDTGEEVRRYGIGDEWDTSDVEKLEPPALPPEFSADGSRDASASVYTGGQTRRIEITVESIEGEVDGDTEVRVTDEYPGNWSVDESVGDVEAAGDGVVDLGTVTPADVEGDDTVTRDYFVEAPEGAGQTGRYEFGPAVAVATIDEETVTDEMTDTATAYLVGVGT